MLSRPRRRNRLLLSHKLRALIRANHVRQFDRRALIHNVPSALKPIVATLDV